MAELKLGPPESGNFEIRTVPENNELRWPLQADLAVAYVESQPSGGCRGAAMIPMLETPRLLLRPLELADAEQTQILFPHWEIVRYLDKIVPWPYPPDGAHTWYHDFALPAMERGEEWIWTIRLKSSPASMIGSISLKSKENNNRGFWLGLPWQRQGFMTEACEAATDYWFDALKFPVLRVPKAAVNVPSRRISEKSGMRIIATEEREYVSGRFQSEIWEITAEDWHARRKDRGSKGMAR